jgi:hypothetical protein
VDSEISKRETRLNSAYDKRSKTFTTKRQDWDKRLLEKRDAWDAQRQQNFTKMEAKAKTAAQKEAVATYKSAVLAAVNTRRTANDAARAAFRNGVEDFASGHRSEVLADLTTFKGAVTAAETTAKTNCEADPSQGVTIRTTFRNALKTARQDYAATRKDDPLDSQIKTLAQTRDQTIKTNDETFRRTIQTARETLLTKNK